MSDKKEVSLAGYLNIGKEQRFTDNLDCFATDPNPTITQDKAKVAV